MREKVKAWLVNAKTGAKTAVELGKEPDFGGYDIFILPDGVRCTPHGKAENEDLLWRSEAGDVVRMSPKEILVFRA